MSSRQHLTIADKNRLRAHSKQHPSLTQEQLRDWAFSAFGQWIARSTVGHIVRSPEEVSANPTATRFQSGRYPAMEQELYSFLVAQAAALNSDTQAVDYSNLPLKDSELWAKANEILKRTHGSGESVSVAWVHRFKKRHGLHRSQAKKAAAETVEEETLHIGAKRSSLEEEEGLVRKKVVVAKEGSNRAHFTSADDIALLTQVMAIKPWRFASVMDGWHQVASFLRELSESRLDKTAGACQTRVTLLLGHLKAGNTAALKKSGTQEEYEKKCALLREVAGEIGDTTEVEDDKAAMVSTPSKREEIKSLNVVDVAADKETVTQRRLDLLEQKMERKLAAHKRHADEQVRRLETLHREQMEVHQAQHAQLLATIQQQQTMMMDLIKSIGPVASDKQEQQGPSESL